MESGFDEYVARRLPELLRFATALTGHPQLAEDVVQETLIRVHGRWGRIRALERPEPYVRKMVVNEYLGWRRRIGNRAVVPLPTGDLDLLVAPAPDHAAAQDDREALRRVLAGLPRKQRAVLVLRHYEGLHDEEIAEMLGCSRATVRSHASRALTALRGVLGADASREERV